MQNRVLLLLLLLALPCAAWSQVPIPAPLRPDISVAYYTDVAPSAARMAYDKVQGVLYYLTTDGNIYKIIEPASGAAYDTLIYTATNHGITGTLGMLFSDSSLFLSGNNVDDSVAYGKVV